MFILNIQLSMRRFNYQICAETLGTKYPLICRQNLCYKMAIAVGLHYLQDRLKCGCGL